MLGASWGAALQCQSVAPRLLQALANDAILPALAPFRSKRDPPIAALMLSCLISALIVMVGNLNLVAPAVTLFFLLSYASVNLASLFQQVLSHPRWRSRANRPTAAAAGGGVVLCVGG